MINFSPLIKLRFLKLFEHFISETYHSGSIILKPGDLENFDTRCMSGDDVWMCDLIKDLLEYGDDKKVKKMHKVFATKWSGVETIQNENFWIYRGVSPKKGTPLYDKFDKIYVDRMKDKGLTGIFDGVTDYGYTSYTSWTQNPIIAKSYAESRKGDIKIMFKAKVKDLKTFANLFEIGDESEELVIYPFSDRKLEYKVWKE